MAGGNGGRCYVEKREENPISKKTTEKTKSSNKEAQVWLSFKKEVETPGKEQEQEKKGDTRYGQD